MPMLPFTGLPEVKAREDLVFFVTSQAFRVWFFIYNVMDQVFKKAFLWMKKKQ